MRVEFYRHNINKEDIKNVRKVLGSIFLTTGSWVNEFERSFSRYLDVSEAIGVTSCTAALHLSLLALGIKPQDEVITAPLSYVATAHAIEYVGARPVFVDVDSTTGLINPQLIEKMITRRTKAIIPVHLYGQLADMKAIRKIANKHKLKIIEDSAHAIESKREGYRPGQIGDMACFSFYAIKNITSGEGGAVATRNTKIAKALKKLRLFGLSAHAGERYTKRYRHYDVPMLGWKYNMSNIQAALLIGQLKRIEKLWQRRKRLYERYERAFRSLPGVNLITILPRSRSAYHLFTLQVHKKKRDYLLRKLQDNNIGVGVHFRPIHLMGYYRKKYGFKNGDFPNAEEIGARTISLPLYPRLTFKEQNRVISAVRSLLS